jgi:signal transduction histidine kinase
MLPWRNEFRIINPAGGQRWVEGHSTPVLEADGSILWNGFFTDISARKELEKELAQYRTHLEELVASRTSELERSHLALQNLLEDVNETKMALEAANAKLQELDQLKSMFIASMSHELRTPLNSIIGFTGLMLQEMSGAINDEQRDHLERVYRAGKHLLALITDVIDIAKIESGKIVPHAEDFALTAVIDEACDSLKVQMADKGLELVKMVPAAPIPMHSDRRRLLQCLLNFLSNAVKFSESGTVTVKAEKTGAEGVNFAEIAVSDTGVGIKQEDMGRLFHSFVRLESSLKIIVPGTGLGLYLTKKLATEVLGGDVAAESRVGEGSTFRLRVPIVIGTEAQSLGHKGTEAEGTEGKEV